MTKNFLIIAFRNMSRNKFYSGINMAGLGIGMAASLLIFLYVQFELSYEDFNQNADIIYRLTLDLYKGSEYIVSDCETFGPLGPMLKDQLPEVQEFVRMFHNGNQEVKADDKKFYERNIYFADSSVFSVFTYKVIRGNPETALTQPFQSVITASMAKKYFGRTDVLNNSIQVGDDIYKISAVIADVPANTHLKFDLLLSHVTIDRIWDWYEKNAWGGNNEYTYLLMSPGTDLNNFNKKLSEISRNLKDKIGTNRFRAQPIKKIHLYSHKTFEPEVNGNAEVVYFLMCIAIFILIIALVNYINLSTARSIERSREVGIRKILGSVRRQLIGQFMLESAILCVMASGIALVLIFFSLPEFRDITTRPISMDIIYDPGFWILVTVILVTGILFSGLYPAVVLSSFKPSRVLKGAGGSISRGKWFRNGLVVFQFSCSIILIAGTCIVYLQIKHLRNQDLGMNIDQTLAIHAPETEMSDSLYLGEINNLKTELLKNPSILRVSGSESLPGLSLHELSTNSGIRRMGQDKQEGGYNYYIISIDADYIPTLGLKMISGRNFEDNTANSDEVIINEEAVHLLGFDNPDEAVGNQINYYTRWPGEPSTIIGVIKNYYQRSPKDKQIPMIFPYTAYGDYLTLRLKSDDIRNTVDKVRSSWDEIFPNSAFQYFFLDDKYDQQYSSDNRFGEIVAIFSTLAIFIASLGLFGLSSYTILRRTKEIGIRKVLGASVRQIVRLLSIDFVRLIIIAGAVALPVAYFSMKEWLLDYVVRINLKWWMFMIPAGIVLVIAMVTVSLHTIKASLTNPADSLRYE